MQPLKDIEFKRKLFRDLKTGQIIYGFKEELKQLDGSLKKDSKAHNGTIPRPFVVIGKKDNNEVIVVNAKLMSDIFDIAEKEGIPLELAVPILSIVQTISIEEFSIVCGKLNNKDFYNMIFSLDQVLKDYLEIINMPEANGTIAEKMLESKLIEQFSIYEKVEDFEVSIDVEYDNYDGIDYKITTDLFCGALFYEYCIDDKEYAAIWNFDRNLLHFGTSKNDEYDCFVDTYDGSIVCSNFDNDDDIEYFVSVFYELAYDFIKNYIFTYELDIHDVVYYDGCFYL